jgi:hypothetical protein
MNALVKGFDVVPRKVKDLDMDHCRAEKRVDLTDFISIELKSLDVLVGGLEEASRNAGDIGSFDLKSVAIDEFVFDVAAVREWRFLLMRLGS